MPVIPKEPLEWLPLFRQQIDELFNFLSDIEQKDSSGERPCTPLVDIFETPETFNVEIDLPGFHRDDLSVSICCNMLVVEGHKRAESRGKEINYICLERCFGRFCKTIEIPPAVELDKVTAKYDKGVLMVSFPHMKDRSTVREIPIG